MASEEGLRVLEGVASGRIPRECGRLGTESSLLKPEGRGHLCSLKTPLEIGEVGQVDRSVPIKVKRAA